MTGGGPRVLSQSSLLARVPELGALCLVGEGAEAGRHGAGLPQGWANPVNPVLRAQPYGLSPPTTLLHPGEKNIYLNGPSTGGPLVGICLKNPKDQDK